MELFDWMPDAGGAETPEFSVRTAQFGDGYAQEVGDGINNVRWRVPVQFKEVEKSVGDEIEAFIVRHGGYQRFAFKRPFGALGLFVCKEFSRTPVGHSGLTSISATFEERFAP